MPHPLQARSTVFTCLVVAHYRGCIHCRAESGSGEATAQCRVGGVQGEARFLGCSIIACHSAAHHLWHWPGELHVRILLGEVDRA